MSGLVGALAGRIAQAVREAQEAQAQALAQAATAAAARERQRLVRQRPPAAPATPASAPGEPSGTTGSPNASGRELPSDAGEWVRTAFRGGPALLGALIVAEALAPPLALRRPER
ncbi:MAG: hypothetical protein ABI346_01005 [Candidatus Baltobacteraceae bacterium]